MKLSDLEECHTADGKPCPLLDWELCTGGYTVSGRGDPIEPPCCSIADPNKTDLEEYARRLSDMRRREWEEQDRRRQQEQEQARKRELAKRRRDYVKCYCIHERAAVKRLKSAIRCQENAISFARSMAEAVKVTNEAIGYRERYKPKTVADLELEKLRGELVEAEARLRKKQKKARQTEMYRAIV